MGQWVQVGTDLPSYDLRAVDFVNESLGFAVGDSAILKTVDGGLSWTISNTEVFNGTSLTGVTIDSAFSDDSEFVRIVGVVVGSERAIGRSPDEGTSWQKVHPGMFHPLLGACSNGNRRHYAFGDEGWMFESPDSGLTWKQKNIFPWVNPGTVLCLPDGTLWVAGHQLFTTQHPSCCAVFMKSEDGGDSWTTLGPDAIQGKFIGLQFLTDEIGYAFSTSRYAFQAPNIFWRTSDGGNKWDSVAVLETERGSPRFAAMAFADERTGVIVGRKHLEDRSPGVIRWTEDGGETWSEEQTTTYPRFHDVVFVGDRVAIAVGEDGMILRNENLVTTETSEAEISGGHFSGEVFPNPANSTVTFRLRSDGVFPPESVQIQILDVLGRVVSNVRATGLSRDIRIPIDGLPAGLYFYRIDARAEIATGNLLVVR